MPVYKQFKYYKIRDCPSCRFYKFNECHQPVPNDFNCNFITRKEFVHKYYFKTSINGRTFVRRGFRLKKDAEKAEMQFRKEIIGENYFIDKSKRFPTYNELLNEYYNFIKTNYKKTYTIKIKRVIENYYYKLLPDVPINQLVKMDADKVQKIIAAEHISVKTKNDHLNFLKRFFNWVKKYYDYDYRYISLIPQYRDYTIHRLKRKSPIIEFSDFLKIFKACDDPFYQLALLTLFIFGYRIGELLALTVDSFNFADESVEIYQAVNFKGGKGKEAFDLVTPKTASSERIQQMPKLYSTLVKKHIDEHHLKKKDFIFFRANNKKIPMHENTFRRQLEKYCRMYNPEFHPHMLRTSICTHLREKGVSLEEVSKYLGHADLEVTAKYYSKSSNQKNELLNDVINDFIQKII